MAHLVQMPETKQAEMTVTFQELAERLSEMLGVNLMNCSKVSLSLDASEQSVIVTRQEHVIPQGH